jgi:hypothetical protein
MRIGKSADADFPASAKIGKRSDRTIVKDKKFPDRLTGCIEKELERHPITTWLI